VSAIDAAEVLRIARAVARRYAQRCWWADEDDMTSVASLAVLDASRHWDPQVGVPFDGYAARAASNQVREHLWRESSPLSGGLHDPRKNIEGVTRASLDVRTDDGEWSPRPELVQNPDPGPQLDDAQWRLRVRRRVRALSGVTQDGGLARAVLLDGRAPSELAPEGDLKRAYRAVQILRKRVRLDPVSYKLMRLRRL
jgi:hypothetical protein